MKKLLLGACALFCSASLHANIVLNTGPAQGALAGGGLAVPLDGSWLKFNPASISKLGKRLDYSLEYLVPERKHRSDGPAPYGNPNVSRQTDRTASIIPAFSYISPINEKWTWGVGNYVISGFGNSFKQSRSLAGSFDSYDRRIDYQAYRLTLGLAYEFDNGWSIGLSPNINYSRVRADFANPTNGAQTKGDYDWDNSFGAGFTIGAHKEWERWAFGVSYSSTQWMQGFDKYNDLFTDSPNQPPILNLGLAYKLTEDLTLTADYQLYMWENVDVFSKDGTQGGFGYEDQELIKFGLIYQYDKTLKLLAGYSKGNLAQSHEDIYVNAIAPILVEQFASIGFIKELDEHFEVSASYTHGFHNGLDSSTVADTDASFQLDILTIGLSYKF